MNTETLLGVVLLFPDLRFLWFEGRPLGILLAVIGAFELGVSYLRERQAARSEQAGRSAPDE